MADGGSTSGEPMTVQDVTETLGEFGPAAGRPGPLQHVSSR